MLKQRLITGFLLLIFVFFGVIFLPKNVFDLLTLFVVIGIGSWEWSRLVGFTELFQRAIFIFAIIAFSLSFYLSFDSLRGFMMVVSLLTWGGILFLLANYHKGITWYKEYPYLLQAAGFIVLISAWFLLIALHDAKVDPDANYHPWGARFTLYLIILVAIADSAAYFSGKKWGKNKLAPELSPGKTLEGMLGALVASGLWGLFFAWAIKLPLQDLVFFVILSIVTALVSIAGDLFISLIKREAGQKDSGNLLPGHGGLLDRVDSLLAAIPFFTFGLYWGGLILWS